MSLKNLAKIAPPLVTLLALALFVLPAAAMDEGWRSDMYPDDWTPEWTDAEGRFVHDFSYAGYHMGERRLPKDVPGPILDVTKEPYNADNTGQESATAAIQRAINDAGLAGGGTVYLPAGTYRLTFAQIGPLSTQRLSVALMIPHPNVVLKGAGTDQTFLFLDETVTRGRTMIQVKSLTDAFTPQGQVHPLRADVDARERVIPLHDGSDFTVGDWVVLNYDLTPEWVAEHNMSDGWDSSIAGPEFIRRVVAVDAEANTITIDVPLRYPVLVRDNARVHKIGEPLSEVGLADFSIAMREHPATSGWGDADHSVLGAGAYDVHGSRAITLDGVVNSWVRDVATYNPEGNNYAHIHSIGLSVSRSRFVTVRRVSIENPQYRGGAGNGYPFVVGSQETLFDDVRAVNGRHNFTITGQRASGNVIYRGYIANPIESLPADFHAYLSMANLIDNLTIDNDRFEARDRSGAAGVSGFPKHGVSTTQSVFWNNIGLAYRSDMPAIIRSDQYGWGYVIGTRGPAPRVHATAGSFKTAPADWLEGEGAGDTLNPQSLYLDQLQRRLLREGKEDIWDEVSQELLPLPDVESSAEAELPGGGKGLTELPLIYEQDFEGAATGSLPNGWEAVERPERIQRGQVPDVPSVVDAPSHIGTGKVLYVGRTAGTSNVTGHASYTFAPATRKLRVAFDMYTTTARRSLLVTLGGSSLPAEQIHRDVARSGIFVAMNGGEVRSLIDAPSNTWAHGGFYLPGRWERIVLDIDIAAQTFDVYIGGSTQPANSAPIGFHSTQFEDLNTIGIAYQSVSTHNNTDPVYIDNLVIWGE